jgi:hypothetical protein
MRAEHREIDRLLEEIAAGIADAAAPVDALHASLHAELGDHNVKAERALYPTADERLGAEEADRLVRKIQRFGS